MGMFDNYPQPEDYVPDNRPKCPEKFHLDIMTGETASHTFDVPFDVTDEHFGCSEVEVIYKLGLKVIIRKTSEDLDIVPIEKPNGFVFTAITCHLSADETLYFHNTLLSARVQLRFTMNDNSIQYSEIYPVKVIDSLNGTQQPAPSPTVNVGFGWTED